MKVRHTTTGQQFNGIAVALHNGDRLSQREFHRRYKLTPPGVKAELIGGIVYMPSPVGRLHGLYNNLLSMILGIYASATPGVDASAEATVILADDSEPQPDNHLRLLPEFLGRTRLDDEDMVVGGPELLGEIAHSSVAIDMGQKKDDYENAGVLEYLVVCISEQELHWFHFPTGREISIDKNGILKSKVFPGLWIDEKALLARDSARSIEVIQQGLASREHAEFVARLQRTRNKSK